MIFGILAGAVIVFTLLGLWVNGYNAGYVEGTTVRALNNYSCECKKADQSKTVCS